MITIINKLVIIFPIIFFPVISIIVLFLLGFGITFLILPKSLKPFWLWISPWSTIITSIFILVITSLFGLSVKQVIWPLIFILIFVDLYSIYKVKEKIRINIKEDCLLFCFVILSLILNLSPLIRRDRIITTISLGNNDVISYTTAGDYLKNNSISKSFKEYPEESTGVLLIHAFRWGTPIVNSFFLTLFNFDGYQYTYISQAILFSLFIPLCYVLFKILYGQNILGLVLVCIITGFNSNLLYILYHDFFGQVLFWGIEILLYIFFYSYLFSEVIIFEKYSVYDYIIGILISVLFFSYHEPAVFMFAPIGLFLLFSWIFSKKKVFTYIKALIRIASIILIVGSTSVIRAIILAYQQAFMVDPNQPIGWQLFRNKISYANPFEAMGFWSIHNFNPMPNTIAIILSFFVVLIIILGILKSKYRILTISHLIIFLLFYYWTIISQENFFAYNRALTYTLPLLIILFSIGLVNLYKKKKIILLIIVILISLELWSVINFNKRFIREHVAVEKSYISILDLRNKNIKEPIYDESYINIETPLWKRMWIRYFLYSKNISSVPTLTNSQQFENNIPDNGLVLISKPTPWQDSLKIIFKDIIWENEYYQLGHICNNNDCLEKSKYKLNEILIGENEFEDSLLINGWNIKEGKTRWANKSESTLRLVTMDVYPTKLTFEALSLSKPQEITVYLDDELLGKMSIDKGWKNYSLPINYLLDQGVHKIKFVYSNGYRPIDIIPDNLDSRTLYVNFKKITIE